MVTRTSRLKALKNQVRRLEKRLQARRRQSQRLSNLRLLTFAATLGASALLNFTLSEIAGGVVLLAGAAIFAGIALWHARVKRAIRRTEIWLQLKRAHIARMEIDWQHVPAPRMPAGNTAHPFAFDLDLAGPRSLHQLIDTAISREGSERLLDWLSGTRPDVGRIRMTQKIIRALIPCTHFRNHLFLQFALVSPDLLEGRKLLDWLGRRKKLRRLALLVPILSLMAASTIALFALRQTGALPAYWVWSLVAYAFVFLMNHGPVAEVLDDAVFLDDELARFRAVLRFLEYYPVGDNSTLADVCRPFREGTRRPSAQIRKLKLIALLIGLRGNPVLAMLLNTVCPWDYIAAALLERSKAALAQIVPEWLQAFFRLEALLSLANYGYLNPAGIFPEVRDTTDAAEPVFMAAGLGHPLIPEAEKIRNDFALRHVGEIALFTGSNMSGKSTFLKTLGINLCLAFAGAPVDAVSLRCSPLRLYTCIKINDSVTEGFSYFYAEVKRLRALLDFINAGDPLPLFFLIDEIFKGTNNRERLIGSRAYIRALAGKHGLGAISTHDLELVSLADEIRQINNYHFREEVVNGKMSFDYKIRRGPCPTTNALKIMQIEGLPVSP